MTTQSNRYCYHTPEWYSKRVSEEGTAPKVIGMLKHDCGDVWDSKGNPEENLALYEELFNSYDFQRWNAPRLAELYIEEMKQDNKAEYFAMRMGYSDTEERYLTVVNDIATDLLSGSDKQLLLYKKRLRSEYQSLRNSKKKKQERIMHGNVKGMKPVDEDETFFTWEKLFGGQKDYIRESEYHAVWIYLLNSVEKRMKMILADNLELVRDESKKHSKRLIELDAVISTELNRGSISRWLQLPIREMENFNELFADKIKEITNRVNAKQIDKKDLSAVDKIIKKQKTLLDGFE